MSPARPMERIEFAHKEVERYREDVDDWKRGHDALANDCWVWEDLIAKANFLVGRILKLDEEIQAILLANPGPDGNLQNATRGLLAEWLNPSLVALCHAERLRAEYRGVDGSEELAANIRTAQAILTPDEAFFVADELWSIRDQAVRSHRAGQTEPLLDNECVH